jgi:hypothetical protein
MKGKPGCKDYKKCGKKELGYELRILVKKDEDLFLKKIPDRC